MEKYPKFYNYIITLADAAHSGNIKLVSQRLADKKVDVDELNQAGVTPLMLAAQEGHLEVVRLLLNHGATIDLQTSGGLTALMCAMLRNQEEVALELLKRGANPSIKDEAGQDALSLAHTLQNNKFADIIQDYMDLPEKKRAIFSNLSNQSGFFLPKPIVDMVTGYTTPELNVASPIKK
jgi:ankyrin repeat protein